MSARVTDLASRAHVTQLVDAFYIQVRGDARLGPVFDEVAHVDWVTHLPRMYDFWETVLFGAAAFKGNPLAVHRELARLTALTPDLFARWLALFHSTVDRLFSGPVADEAKRSASRIAYTMQLHVASDAMGAAPAAPVA